MNQKYNTKNNLIVKYINKGRFIRPFYLYNIVN